MKFHFPVTIPSGQLMIGFFEVAFNEDSQFIYKSGKISTIKNYNFGQEKLIDSYFIRR